MSVLDNYEIPNSGGGGGGKKRIHFSDGSTMEVEDEEVDHMEGKLVQETKIHPSTSSTHPEDSSQPPIDPKSLSWRDWIKHYSSRGASRVMGGLDYSGETLAYYLGITSPKYQHEIDEYNRMVRKKALNDAEAKTWSSVGPSAGVRMGQVRGESTNGLPQNYTDTKDQDEKV